MNTRSYVFEWVECHNAGYGQCGGVMLRNGQRANHQSTTELQIEKKGGRADVGHHKWLCRVMTTSYHAALATPAESQADTPEMGDSR